MEYSPLKYNPILSYRNNDTVYTEFNLNLPNHYSHQEDKMTCQMYRMCYKIRISIFLFNLISSSCFAKGDIKTKCQKLITQHVTKIWQQMLLIRRRLTRRNAKEIVFHRTYLNPDSNYNLLLLIKLQVTIIQIVLSEALINSNSSYICHNFFTIGL